MLPDWAPNLHPLIVHFPISLLVAAALVDVVGLFRRESAGFQLSAVVLYGAGAVGAVAAYVTGNQAAEAVSVPTEAISTLNTHQDLAFYTMLFFGLYAAARIVLFVLRRKPNLMLHIGVVVVGIAGQLLVWQTAERGGELVFAHGVGVAAVDTLASELDELRRQQRAAQAAPVDMEDGGFVWAIRPGAEDALAEAFTFVEGSPEDLEVRVEEDGDGYALVLEVEEGPVMFVRGQDLAGVDAEAEVDVSGSTGSVALVHNVQGPETYHYLRLSAEEAALGRRSGGADEPLGSRTVDTAGWTTLRATGDQGHFYGYVDGETVTHGHSPTPPPGPVGLRLEGSGTVRLRLLEVQAVQ